MDFLDKRPKIEDLASLERDLSRDPLYKLTKEEK